MSSQGAPQACPFCQSDRTVLVGRTLLLSIYICLNCGKRSEIKRDPKKDLSATT